MLTAEWFKKGQQVGVVGRLSGLILGVNPFNQPGVEAYKKNMFALLDKPGYEADSKAIKERIAKEG